MAGEVIGGFLASLFGGGGGGGGDNWFTVGAATNQGATVGAMTNSWQAVLAALIGTYGMIRQYQQLERQVDLAERGVDQAESYLNIARDAYANISIPTFVRGMQAYDTYGGAYAIYEAIFLSDAFRFGDYYPEYTVQEGRTLGLVQAQFDRAARQRKRAAGKYNTGRIVWDSQWFATMAALGKVDAINHGYRYEDSKKITLDGWYWERRKDGARMNEAHAVRVTNGLQGSATVVSGGLSEMGRGVGAVQQAQAHASLAYGNKADFWGSLGNSGFYGSGFATGMQQGGYRQPIGITPGQGLLPEMRGTQSPWSMLRGGDYGLGGGVEGPAKQTGSANAGIGSQRGYY